MARADLLRLLPASKVVLFFFFFFVSSVMARDMLTGGQTLGGRDGSLTNGPYRFTMQNDCNLVLYKDGKTIWASNEGVGTASGCYLKMQKDANLVVYKGNSQPVWTSNTARKDGNYVLVLQDDGNVVIYGGSIWSTGTNSYMVKELFNITQGDRLPA